MKTAVAVFNGFEAWFSSYATSKGFTPTQYHDVKVELAKEVGWVDRNRNYAVDIGIRVAKYNTLIQASETGDISAFDQFWQYRMDFWAWIQA